MESTRNKFLIAFDDYDSSLIYGALRLIALIREILTDRKF